MQPFHLAFPVHDLEAARTFYGGILGCSEGRSSEHWIDFNLLGHQIVAHLVPRPEVPDSAHSDAAHSHAGHNVVDSHAVPVPHFGVVLSMADWHALADRLRGLGTQFIMEPKVRFAGKVGEQATMFFKDPSGNALEFKAFADPEQLFAK